MIVFAFPQSFQRQGLTSLIGVTTLFNGFGYNDTANNLFSFYYFVFAEDFSLLTNGAFISPFDSQTLSIATTFLIKLP